MAMRKSDIKKNHFDNESIQKEISVSTVHESSTKGNGNTGRKKPKVYRVGQGKEGRPLSMEEDERMRISVYMSRSLYDRLQSALDRNLETQNQMILRMLSEKLEEIGK